MILVAGKGKIVIFYVANNLTGFKEALDLNPVSEVMGEEI